VTIDWSTFVIQLVAFLILYLLLSKYAFKPLFSIMEARKKHIQEQLDNAANSRDEASKLLQEQTAAFQATKQEAHSILEQARVTSEKQAEDIVRQAKAEASRLKDEAVSEIESEKNKAIASLRTEVAGLSVSIASKIIEKNVDAKEQEQLVEKTLKDLGGKL
jgi:F-type H+-transporting ATPase subunit b